ncbi:MAG: APC family permease [Candidatus Heimdallarchaeota archaeon]
MSEEVLFVRKATGLVRGIGTWSVAAMCFTFTYLAAHFLPFFALVEYPGANVPLTYLIAPLIWGWSMFCAMFLVAAFPRTSSDYVAISRVVSPYIGYLSSVGLWMAIVPWISGAAMYGSILTGNAFSVLGMARGSDRLMSIGETLVGVDPVKLLAIVVIFVIIYAILGILGIRYTGPVITVAFGIYIVSMVLSVLGILYIAAGGVDRAMSMWNSSFGAGAWQEVETIADNSGWASYVSDAAGSTNNWGWPGGTVGSQTALAIVPAGFAVWGYEVANVAAGEIKTPKKTFALGALISFVLMTIFMAIFNFACFKAYGVWISKASYVLYGFELSATPQQLPAVLPSMQVFTGGPFASTNSFLALIMLIGPSFGWYVVPIVYIIILTRVQVAWAFDRFAPSFFAEVNDKYHTPHWGVIFVCAISLFFAYSHVYAKYQTLVNTLPGAIFRYLFLSWAAMLLPLNRPEVFERSYTWKFLKVPLSTIIGLISAAMMTFMLFATIVSMAGDWIGIIFQVVWFTIGTAIYIIYWFYNKSKGIDVAALWREIPPA